MATSKQQPKGKIQFGGTFGSSNSILGPKLKTKKIEYPDGPKSVESDSIVELTQLQKDFKEAARKEEQLKADNTNTEFLSVIIFKNNAQRDEFYNQIGIKGTDLQYIDGQKLIAALELNIQKVNLKNPGKFKCNLEIANLAMK